MRVKGHSERMRVKANAYRGFKDNAHHIGIKMGQALGLSPDIIEHALSLYDKYAGKAPRTLQGTMVDCLYFTANKYGAKVTIRQFAKKLKDNYGVSTQPKPRWLKCD
tara:strand:- start:1172 stop:1492 length:321 start_codon:yes stop_codon:yes gene_type:complete